MPYSKDILNLKRDLVKAADTNYHDPTKLIRDARKAQDGMVPYSGMGARSTNEYFPSIEIPGAQLKAEKNYRHIDTSLGIGGRYSEQILTSDVPFFVAGMSYGSLKLPAKIALHLALNVLAKDGIRIMMNTGEGGALPWELYGSDETRSRISSSQRERMMDYAERLLKEHNLDRCDREELFRREYPLVTQYASGRFWKDPSYLLNADAIEIKIGQGAKIGHGGLLPSAKVTELVAENRGIPSYKAAHSPSRHLDILGPEDLVAKVLELREITEWKKPIIVKVGASRVYDDTTIILKSYADAIAIDGYVGGTGAAPWEVRDVIGINTIPSIKPARGALDDYYSNHEKDESKLLVHGGIWDSERIAKCIALGADGVGIGTGFMLTMGCTLVQDCYTNECPAGLTGSYEKLNIQESVNGIVNYVKGTMMELQNIAGSLGRKSIHDLTMNDLVATDEVASIVTGLSFKNGTTYQDQIKARIRAHTDGMGIKGARRGSFEGVQL
jgi:glutamate synthase domain-containing protein 2